VYLEEDVVIISTALKTEELVHLADALPDSDSATNLDWGIGEALRTLEEAPGACSAPPRGKTGVLRVAHSVGNVRGISSWVCKQCRVSSRF